MKKQLFTLVLMIALITGAGSVIGQTSTSPWEGTTFTYTVSGLHTGDIVTVSLTPSASTDATTGAIPTSAIGTGIWHTPTTTFAALAADGNKSFEVTWGSNSYVAGTSYKLWVTVTNSCSNYRFINITPEDNTFNLSIAAIGSGNASNTGLTLASTNAPASECLVPSKLLDQSYNASGANDGNTYVYFRIKRTNTSTFAWTYDLSFIGLEDATDTQFSLDGSDWTATPFNADDQSIAAGDNEVYVRVKIPARSTSRTIKATISDQTLGSLTIDDNNAADDVSASYVIEPMPSIGGFSGL